MISVYRSGREWGDENAHRWFPFSEEPSAGALSIPDDVFVDAFICAVSSDGSDAVARVVLADFAGGVVEVSLGGYVLRGLMESGLGSVRLVSEDGFAGEISVGPGFETALASGVKYDFSSSGGIPFDASCVCPVPAREVTSVSFGGVRLAGGPVSISGDGVVSPRLSERPDGEFELAFDVVSSGEEHDTGDSQYNGKWPNALKAIYVTALGRTPIVVGTYSGQGVWHGDGEENKTYEAIPVLELYTTELSTENVCYEAHRESPMSEIFDTCEDVGRCEPPKRPPYNIGFGIRGCSVWLNTPPDLLGAAGKNGVLVTPVQGGQMQNAPRLAGLSGKEALDELKKIASAPIESGNGIMISIPGASHV